MSGWFYSPNLPHVEPWLSTWEFGQCQIHPILDWDGLGWWRGSQQLMVYENWHFFLFQKINDKVQQDSFPSISIKIRISNNSFVAELGNCALCLWLLLLFIVFLVTIKSRSFIITKRSFSSQQLTYLGKNVLVIYCPPFKKLSQIVHHLLFFITIEQSSMVRE